MTSRATAITLSLTLLALVAYAVTAKGETTHEPTQRVVGYGLIRFNGLGAERWAQRYRRDHAELRNAHRRIAQLQGGLRHQLSRPQTAITVVFGPYAGQAIQVADCETGGTFDTGARNGQYLGLFQMGSSERAQYGHGSTALEQARAAFVYFVVSGRNWSRWSCKP